MILYKYRQDTGYTEDIFKTGKVWLSKPADLNDPFEGSLHEIEARWIATQATVMKKAQLEGFVISAKTSQERELLAKMRTMDLESTYRMYRRFCHETLGHPPSDPDQLFPNLQGQLTNVGIFSLSELSDDPVMWAHYGQDHKGLCLGFEITDSSRLADPEYFLKLNYADSLPKMEAGFKQQITFSVDERGKLQSSSRIAFSDPAFRAAISTKPTRWEYEREWRYVEPQAGSHVWPGPLVEIVFGLRCSPERREFYLKLASEHVPNDMRIYEMVKVPNTNSLKRKRVQQLSTRATVGRTITVSMQDGSVDELMKQLSDLMERRQLTAALKLLEPALAKMPKSAELWRKKGIALGQSGDPEGALECFNRAVELDPQFFSAWYQRGVALSELRRYEEAVESYERASTLNPNDASTAFNLGCVLVQLREPQKAAPQLRRAQKLGHPRAEYALRTYIEGA